MAEALRWFALCTVLVVVMVVGVTATARNGGISGLALTRNVETEALQSSSNPSMEARSGSFIQLRFVFLDSLVAEVLLFPYMVLLFLLFDSTGEEAVNDAPGNKEHAVQDPEEVVSMVEMSIHNSTERRKLGYFSCGTGNPIDDCWRCDPHWQKNRKRLADCGIGFGRNAIGGRDGRFYVVTDPRDDDPVNPRPGTLRHAVIQDRPLWIVFKRDMVIQLKQELIMNSFKTIDGRGANVHIANGGCITIQFVTNVIIHGLHIHDCKPTGNAMVRSSETHFGWRTMADGDAISIFGSSHIWVDHNSLSHCADGLVDAVMGSTAITISNNHMTHHNEVMLLGHSDSYTRDKQMQVTIAYNHFGEGLIQRMPRCRHGYFHVVNNDYTHWEMYAIGGSANPTINSQGNRYNAPINRFAKEVTKRVDTAAGVWKGWNWRSEGDLLLNGAYFTPSGAGASASYARASSLGAKSSSMVGSITSNAGALGCRRGRQC
ncbi:unnamed protein product [Linum trigynum]|uniref:Pectate lyase n=1 Tax=Linum trigynum TaxID=586398 RepID=A0AAV2CEY3_9ROSI